MQPQLQLFGTPGQIDVLAAGTGSVRVQLSDALTEQLAGFVSADQLSALVNQAVTKAIAALKQQIGSGGGSLNLGNLTESGSAVLTITGGTGAVVGNVTLQVAMANWLQSGCLSFDDWTTFNNKQDVLTTGDLVESGSSVLIITGGTGAVIGSGLTIQLQQADSTTSGYLGFGDFATFFNKWDDPRSAFIPFTGTLSLEQVGWVNRQFIEDAAADGTTYGRKNNAWVAAGGGGTDVLQVQCFS